MSADFLEGAPSVSMRELTRAQDARECGVLSDQDIEISGLRSECARLSGELRSSVEAHRDDVRELNERLSQQARDYLETMTALRAENVKLRMILGLRDAGRGFDLLSSGLKLCSEKLEEFSQKLVCDKGLLNNRPLAASMKGGSEVV